MGGFHIKLTKTQLHVDNRSDVDWVSISLSAGSCYVYISLNTRRVYWIGRRTGLSAALSVKFNDTKNQITVNSYKIVIHSDNIYRKIKQKARYYRLLATDDADRFSFSAK
jgi:hypothetical protein